MNNAVTNANFWLARFGLDREPFSQSPDDSFFLLDSERAQRLNMLYHLIQDKGSLLLVTGVKGSGKTSLLHKFLAMGTTSWRYCLIRANAMMNPDQVLRHIVDGFGLEPDTVNFNSAIEKLRQRLIELRRSGLTSLLIVDDAQELPAASLTMLMKLSDLRDGSEGLLSTVLFSEPQVREMLSSVELAELRQRITHTMKMPALSKKQTADYINYRLSVAGLSGRSPFSRWKLNKIYKQSGGIPASINEQANKLLRGMHGQTSGNDNEEVTPGVPLRLVPVLGLVALAVAGGYWLAGDKIAAILDTGPKETLATLELPVQAPPVPAPPAPVAEPLPAEKQAGETPVPADPVPVTPVQPDTVGPAKPASEPVARAQALPGSKDWLSGQDPEHYTLQMMGSRKRDLIEKFVKNHNLEDKAGILVTERDKSPWYVLVYGSFPGREQASQALASMPKELRQSGPWPRKIGDFRP